MKAAEDEREAAWIADVFSSIRQAGFRVPKPVRGQEGSWATEGWVAWEFLEGSEEKGRFAEKIDVSRKFHAALMGVPDPGFLRSGEHQWAVADRVAWNEQIIEPHPKVAKPLAQLRPLMRPVSLPDQVIHGDLGAGNILFCPERLPAVIDFAPAWRPARFAIAVGVVDLMAWEGADESVLDLVSEDAEVGSLLARALGRRIVEADHPLGVRYLLLTCKKYP